MAEISCSDTRPHVSLRLLCKTGRYWREHKLIITDLFLTLSLFSLEASTNEARKNKQHGPPSAWRKLGLHLGLVHDDRRMILWPSPPFKLNCMDSTRKQVITRWKVRWETSGINKNKKRLSTKVEVLYSHLKGQLSPKSTALISSCCAVYIPQFRVIN